MIATVNPATGAATSRGNTGVQAEGDLAFVQGRLWLSTSSNRLYELNPTNGAATDRGLLRTVPEFRAVCALHDNIHALVVTIQDHAPLVQDRLPEGFRDWTLKARLKGLTTFAEIARAFVLDPPLALTQSLTARDVLTALRGGQVDVAVEILGPVLPQLRGKALRALAVTSERRATALPERRPTVDLPVERPGAPFLRAARCGGRGVR